jgi:hypothetical protein
MQSNTTGLSMELILDMIFSFGIFAVLAINMKMSKKISNLETETEFYKRKFLVSLDEFGKDIDRLDSSVKHNSSVVENIHRFLLAQKEAETTKPIRPNNWDSVKEAFKGPVRIEINERN